MVSLAMWYLQTMTGSDQAYSMPTINFQNCGHPPPSSNPLHFFSIQCVETFLLEPFKKKKRWLHTVEPCQIEMMPYAARVSVGAICSPRALPAGAALGRRDHCRVRRCGGACRKGRSSSTWLVRTCLEQHFLIFSCCFSIATWRSFKNYDLLKPT